VPGLVELHGFGYSFSGTRYVELDDLAGGVSGGRSPKTVEMVG